MGTMLNAQKPAATRALRPGGGARSARLVCEPAITVLHIDDDPNDTALLQAAARKAAGKFTLHNVEDGEAAIAYLSGSGIYADRERFRLPALILLDLKMPRATGFEVLKWIRSHPELGSVPVIILSGSELQDDIRHAYSVGANSYLVKPLGFRALVKMVENLNTLWLSANLQPAV
jgi:CheY-like chemotaxis protein